MPKDYLGVGEMSFPNSPVFILIPQIVCCHLHEKTMLVTLELTLAFLGSVFPL